MTEMVNPYIAGAPVVETRMFFGREDVFDWIQNSLTGRYADHILVIHGQRRVGKTSVLKQLGNRLPEKYIPVFFDLQGRTHTTLDRFLWWLAREIVRVLKQEREISVPAPEKEVFTADPEYFETHFLPGLRPVLGERSLLLTFDEFDNLEESEVKEDLARPLIDYLRRMMGEPGLNFIFSIGSSGRKLENMQATYTEFFKTALYKKISFLSRDQTLGLVTRPVEGLLEYDRQAVERIYGITSGHPYFTQLTCHELFSLCQRTGELRIRESDVESILDDIVERGTVNLKFTWDEASDIEKWALATLAHEKDTADNRAIADSLRRQRVRFSESDLTSGVLRLREKDILTEENRFVIYLLKLWLKKNRPLEQVREELTEINPIANRYIEIGLEFHDSGQYDKAIENFREALAVAPEHIQAQVNVALSYMAQKNLDQAVVEFDKALAMDDEDVTARSGLCEAHLALGDAARAKGKIKDAALFYQKVLSINAEHTEARGRMAEVSRQRAEKALSEGRDEEALAAFSEALKFTPEDEALSTRYEQAKVEKRVKVLASLLAKAEKEQSARNWDGALSILQNALELDPGSEKARTRLAAVQAEQRKEQLQSILARAERAAQARRWGLVIAALEEYLTLEPGDAKVQARSGEARRKLHEAEVDEACTRARSLARQERWEETAAAWGEVLKIAPEEGETVQAEIEKIKKAQALAKTYLEAQTAFTKKNYDRATALFKEIVVQDENYRDASRRMAEAIELRRTVRKWWQSKWLWGVVVSSIVLVVGWLAFRPGSPLMSSLLTTPAATGEAMQLPPISTVIPTFTVPPPPTATAAPPPYTWARLNAGQFLPRDQINAIVIDPNDAGVMYVGTQNAGIYKSIDGGVSWQPIHNGLGRATIYTLIMDPHDSKILYAGILLGGVYKTTDGGQTWQAVNSGIEIQRNEWVAIVVMDQQDRQHLYFTHSFGLYETTDGGESWQEVKSKESCPETLVGLILDSTAGNNIYASEFGSDPSRCAGGVYKSTNGGKNWNVTGFKTQPQEIQWNTLRIEPDEGQTLYVSSGGKLWVSNDKGETWVQSGEYCNSLVFDPQDPLTAYCGSGYQIRKTTDGGKLWKIVANPAIGNPSTLAILPQDNGTLFLGASGLFMSIDAGKTWEKYGSGLGSNGLELKIAPVETPVLYAQGVDMSLYMSEDAGRNWDNIGTGGSLSFDYEGKVLYSSNNNGFLAISRDNGASWKQSALPLQWAQAIAVHPTNPNRVYAMYTRNTPPYIYYSDDQGKTWIKSAGMRDVNNPRLFFDHDQGKRVYAIGDLDTSRSNDAGVTWENCGDFSSLWTSLADARATVDPRDSNRLFMATRGNGIVTSNDGCQTWQLSNTGLGSFFVNTVTIDPNTPDTVYAGTDGGAYVSFDGGQTWGQINDGLLGATVVYSIVVDKDSNVYAATPYGIFKLEGK